MKEIRRQIRKETDPPEAAPWPRPTKRSECENMGRPCVYFSCRYNLFFDVTEAGSLHELHPKIDPSTVPVSCCLDVADLGFATLDHVATVLNITRERARQIQMSALEKLRSGKSAAVLL